MNNSRNNNNGNTGDQYFDFPASAGSGFAAEQYSEFLDKRVVVYYVDEKARHRKLIGDVTRIDGDVLWMTNTNRYTGERWLCALNCANVKISIISTVEGWGGKPENI